MSLKSKKLIAVLGGRPYKESTTLRYFLIPPIREMIKADGIDLIIATNNKKAASEFRQIKDLMVVETSDELHSSFMNRQREVKPNLGAETRETINRYAIENGYNYALHLDDNIVLLEYVINGKRKSVIRNKPAAFYDIMMLLFKALEKTNSGAVGIEMCQYMSVGAPRITTGFPYSFFVHRVDKDFQFENSTEDDILMSIYNGENGKPSSIIRNSLKYSKTRKSRHKDGNRAIYNSMLAENKRGEYISGLYPDIYTRKVGYMISASTTQSKKYLQHKHRLKKPSYWDKKFKYDHGLIDDIKDTLNKIHMRESGDV